MNKIQSADDLKNLQTWFAAILQKPLVNGDMNRDALKDAQLFEAIDQTILPNAHLASDERIEIYNQQYWFRLVGIMQDEFPVLRHLLKIDTFNALCIEYLKKYPSESYTLNHLCDRFPAFVHAHYKELNAPMICEAADLEYAYIRSFDAINQEALNPEELRPEQIAHLEDLPLSLQESVFLFELSADFVSYRDAVWDDDAEAIFPTLQRVKNYQAIYRRRNSVSEAALERPEFILLKEFKRPCSISQAIERVASKLDSSDLEKLQNWFKRWVELGLFVMPRT